MSYRRTAAQNAPACLVKPSTSISCIEVAAAHSGEAK